MRDWICLSKSSINHPAELSSVGGRELLGAGTLGVCVAYTLLSGTRMKCLAPSYGLGQHHPPWKTVLICPSEPGSSVQLSFPLQRGWLAKAILNLWCVPTEGAAVEGFGRD